MTTTDFAAGTDRESFEGPAALTAAAPTPGMVSDRRGGDRIASPLAKTCACGARIVPGTTRKRCHACAAARAASTKYLGHPCRRGGCTGVARLRWCSARCQMLAFRPEALRRQHEAYWAAKAKGRAA